MQLVDLSKVTKSAPVHAQVKLCFYFKSMCSSIMSALTLKNVLAEENTATQGTCAAEAETETKQTTNLKY